jgi:hypothetical protein
MLGIEQGWMLVDLFNMVGSLLAAAALSYRAFSFALRKQEAGLPCIELGTLNYSSIILTFIGLAPLIFNILGQETDYRAMAAWGAVILASLYLALQKKVIAEGGLLNPPLFEVLWEEVASYYWFYNPAKKLTAANATLVFKVNKRFLFFRRTGKKQLDIPNQLRERVATYLKLYLPFKETDPPPQVPGFPGEPAGQRLLSR